MTDNFDEIESIQDAVRDILDDASDSATAWRAFVESGFGAIAVDGIDDGSLVRVLSGIAEVAGSRLSPIPFVAHSVIAGGVASRLTSEATSPFARGETVVLALPLAHSVWDDAVADATVQGAGDEWRLNAKVENVLGAGEATRFFVTAMVDDQPALFIVERNEPGVTISSVNSADASRPTADIRIADAPARLIAHGPSVRDAVRFGLSLGTACVAAESIGAAAEFLERTIGYLKDRWAFGRPIGAFQSVKHMVVDLFTELALARALLRDALGGLESHDEISADSLARLTLVKVQAGRALHLIANRGILLHGAIGFTWELGAHRYVRRALTDRLLLGDPDIVTQQVVEQIVAVAESTAQNTALDAAESWLAANAPSYVGPRDHVGHFAVLTEAEIAEQVQRARRWERAKFDAGFAGIGVPQAFGGQGDSLYDALTFQALEHRYDLPHWIFAITHGMILPTILQWGTETQKSRFVEPMLTGSQLWCQLFSEPGAGSDLAMLSTRAEKVDGGWRVNGQKVWNSGADSSDFGLLVARTDPDVPKHAGLSVFIVPMDAEGVTVRPIVQASGSALFCEVFFDDVFLPDSAVVGEVGNGWRVALTTLMNERVALTGDGVPFHRARELARANSSHLGGAARERLFDVLVLQGALAAMSKQILEGVRTGADPGPEGSVNKLLTGRAAMAVADFVAATLGVELLRDRDWHEYVIGNLGLLIGGGTEEIQKNIIAERVLGLPTEPKAQSRVSWAEEKARMGSSNAR